MAATSRVACVRIPRFPIGAVQLAQGLDPVPRASGASEGDARRSLAIPNKHPLGDRELPYRKLSIVALVEVHEDSEVIDAGGSEIADNFWIT